MAEPRLDVITLGRVSVDLYGEQIGGPLEDMQSFAKYVGGCPANIAVGAARLGLRSALISRVGDEQMGRFVLQQLDAEGVETSHVKSDPERLTALVILGIRDRETFPHIFYRADCADMALDARDIDPAFIASARALVVTGTHLSKTKVEAASAAAVGYARDSDTKVVLDIDYRPVLWGLTGHAAGEERLLSEPWVGDRLQRILPDCDLVVGTEEEIQVAGGSADTLEALRSIRALSDAVIVLKRGSQGCVVFVETIPERIDKALVVEGFPLTVLNTLGAGDAFMAGLLRGWLGGESWETSCRYGNAAGALVVSRHGCSPAMPSWAELEYFLAQNVDRAHPLDRTRLDHLHRVTTRKRRWPEVCALAFDHRRQLEEIAEENGRNAQSISDFKGLIAQAGLRAVDGRALAGAIVDGRYGAEVLPKLTRRAWWLARPVERPGSRPLEFEAGPNVGLAMRAWPESHVAKCLVLYHPEDDAELRRSQDDRLFALYRACVETGHELLLEVIPPGDLPQDETTLARALTAIYDRGVHPDWWKLPPPDAAAAWAHIAQVVTERDPRCRGILLLGLSAPEAELKRGFDLAADQPLCKGFAVGRSIFQDAAEAWFAGRIDDAAAVEEMTGRYQRLIRLWEARGR